MEHDANRDADNDTGEDPIVDGIIRDALAPYRDLVPPEVLGDMAEVLELFLTTHPVAAPMVRRLQPAPTPAATCERDRSDAPAAVEARKPSGTEGGSR